MTIVPRVRKRASGVRILFPAAGMLVGLCAWALFHFVYELGGHALLIGAGAGASLWLVSEAVYTVLAALLGWPHETRMSVREALAGLLSGGLR